MKTFLLKVLKWMTHYSIKATVGSIIWLVIFELALVAIFTNASLILLAAIAVFLTIGMRMLMFFLIKKLEQ